MDAEEAETEDEKEELRSKLHLIHIKFIIEKVLLLGE